MKLEIVVEGKIVEIVAEGAVTVRVRDEIPAVVTPAEIVETVTAPAPVVVAESVPALPAAADEIVPAVNPAPVEIVPPAPVANDELFKRLCDLRKQLAVTANVPAYTIFKDVTLKEMSEKLPQDLQQFGKIGGVGKSKLEKYGELFLSVIQGVA